MQNFNNSLIELLENRKLLIIENGNVFEFSSKNEETDYLKKLNYEFSKHYTIEGEKYIIINLDFDTIKPFVRYTLKDVYKSLEYNAIVRNFIILFIIIGFLLLNTFLIFTTKGSIVDNNKLIIKQMTAPVNNISTKDNKDPFFNNIQQIDIKPSPGVDNRGGGEFY